MKSKIIFYYSLRQRFILSLLFCILLVSCNSKIKIETSLIPDNSIQVIKPNIDYAQCDISSILDTVRFVKLELTEKSIIGDINKVVVFEDRIYVLDKQTYSLLIFNMDGEFVFRISRIGHGPGEYVQLDFFDIDFENRQIVLTDLMGYRILRYDLKGNFISGKKIPFWVEGVTHVFDNGTIVFANHRDNKHALNQEHNVFYLDSSMRVSKAYFPYNSSNFNNPRIHFITPQTGSFYTYNKNRYFFSPFKNRVYKIEKEGLNAEYLFDFGEMSFNEEYLNQKNKLKHYMNKGNFYQLANVLENNDFVIFSFYQPSHPIGHLGYYSKKDGKVIGSVSFAVGKDYFDGNNIATYGSWIVATVPPEALLSWAKNIEEKKISLESEYAKLKKNVADKITLEDNQVLMFYKLR